MKSYENFQHTTFEPCLDDDVSLSAYVLGLRTVLSRSTDHIGLGTNFRCDIIYYLDFTTTDYDYPKNEISCCTHVLIYFILAFFRGRSCRRFSATVSNLVGFLSTGSVWVNLNKDKILILLFMIINRCNMFNGIYSVSEMNVVEAQRVIPHKTAVQVR